MKATSILLALALPVLSGCPGEVRQASSDDDSIQVILLGQALIEHDPRPYLEAPLRTVTPILSSADLVFTNLEVAVRNEGCECVPTREGTFFHGAGPAVLDYLLDIKVDLLSLANNHSWDYGAPGIASTISEATQRGFTAAGTGANLREATAPAYHELSGLKFALVAMATVNNPPEAAATEARAGVNMLGLDDQADWDRNIAAIQEAARSADVVIAYQHFQVDDPGGWQRRWARATVDAGASLYVSHGQPTLSGVELYRGRPIFYGLGNFIFHTRTEPGHYPDDVWESVIVEMRLARSGVQSISLTPIALDQGVPGEFFFEKRGYPEVAQPERGRGILQRLAELSSALGTTLALRDGQAFVELEAAP
ncbi:MAG: CapA family protein [Acidobacteriota bacterium]|nr:CapA family protein [Acidobacteriota bacterium]